MKYNVILTPDLEDGGYTVTVPALPGCISEGDTVEEALTNISDAIALFLESMQSHGEPAPKEVNTIIATVEVAV
jgi:predicted RNase H-like HicB family nuclease